MSAEDPRAAALRQRYLADQVETATPVQRLLMLQHRLMQDMRAADEAFEAGSIEMVHRNLVHAQRIVLALRDSLNGSDWAGAHSLRAVYGFVYRRLVDCNLTKDRFLLPMCQELIGRILDANTEAAASEVGQETRVGVQVA